MTAYVIRIVDWSSDVCSSDLQEIQRAIWEKFVFLAAVSGITSAVRAPIGSIRANKQARAFLHDAMDEAVQVARAEGVAIPTDYAEDRMAFADQLPASMTSSMHHDLERGNRIELAWLSGDVLARGERSEEHTSELQSLMRISYAVF